MSGTVIEHKPDMLADKPAARLTLTSPAGLSATVSGFGARLLALDVPLPDGRRRDIVVGHATPAEIVVGDRYCGPICGRCAGRIAGGRFTLDGKDYALPLNNGANHLHGGPEGFDAKIFAADVARQPAAVRLTHISADGEEGYPGTVTAHVTYRWLDGATLECLMEATTDAPTIVNLTNHVYFNLAGGGTIHDHRLESPATHFAPTDDGLVPTGVLEPVDGGPFDFRRQMPVKATIDRLPPFYGLPPGIDQQLLLPGRRGALRHAALVSHPPSGLSLEVLTSEAVLQLYTAQHFDPRHIGKGGVALRPFGGLALETMTFSNAINLPGFPSPILRPGERYRHSLQWRIGS